MNDPDPANPIAVEITARLVAMTASLAEATKKTGAIPSEITIGKPQSALDEIAIELWRKSLANIPATPRLVILEYGRQFVPTRESV